MGANKNYVRHNSKYVGHISKYLRHIFPPLKTRPKTSLKTRTNTAPATWYNVAEARFIAAASRGTERGYAQQPPL